LPAHKPYLVVHFEGSFYLDHCYLLGAASLAAITRAKLDIWQVESGPDALCLKYEDDLFTKPALI
jgi:hypothetical protein